MKMFISISMSIHFFFTLQVYQCEFIAFHIMFRILPAVQTNKWMSTTELRKQARQAAPTMDPVQVQLQVGWEHQKLETWYNKEFEFVTWGLPNPHEGLTVVGFNEELIPCPSKMLL